MQPGVLASLLDGAMDRAAKVIGAHGAVADDSRVMGVEVGVVPVESHRDDSDFATHRATELTREGEAA